MLSIPDMQATSTRIRLGRNTENKPMADDVDDDLRHHRHHHHHHHHRHHEEDHEAEDATNDEDTMIP